MRVANFTDQFWKFRLFRRPAWLLTICIILSIINLRLKVSHVNTRPEKKKSIYYVSDTFSYLRFRSTSVLDNQTNIDWL